MLCLDCNYQLDNLPTQRCPECGRTFDSADLTTVNTGKPIPTWAAWAFGPIRWPVYAVAVGGVLTMLWLGRLPGKRFAWTSPVVIGWLVLGMIWLAWPLLRRAVLRRRGWPASVIKPMRRAYWLVPMMIVAMAWLNARQWPYKAAIAYSKPAMLDLAKSVMADPKTAHPNTWVGLYPAKRIRAIPGGVKFTTEDQDVTYKAGYVYLPGVDPAHTSWRTYKYVGDGWWSWREDG